MNNLPQNHVVDPTSLQGCRIRLAFHYRELQAETDPIVRANIAQYLADAAVELAQREAEASINIA
jgi:hypothetical protein